MVMGWQQLVFLEIVLFYRVGLCDLLRPLLAVTFATAAQAVHKDRRAGGLLAAEDAVFTAPLQQFAERPLARCSLCGLVVFVLGYGAVLVKKVMGPVVCVLVKSFAGRSEVEEVNGSGCGARIRRVGLVGDMGGKQVGGDLLCDFWWERSEVVSRLVLTVAVGVCWVGEVDASHAGPYCRPVLLG